MKTTVFAAEIVDRRWSEKDCGIGRADARETIQTRSLSEEFEWRTEAANTRSRVWRDTATASIDSSYRCLRMKLFAER